jgi:hypothetical protein
MTSSVPEETRLHPSRLGLALVLLTPAFTQPRLTSCAGEAELQTGVSEVPANGHDANGEIAAFGPKQTSRRHIH